MSKKEKNTSISSDTLYAFNPQRDLTLPEITLLLQKIIGNWRMTLEQYNSLPEDLKDVFLPIKE